MKVSKPIRSSHSYVQLLAAPPDEAFPLLCPMREIDWVNGWDVSAIYSNSGLAEKDCVFITGTGNRETTWMITQHDPTNYFVEMVRFTPDFTVCKLSIRLEDRGDATTAATVTYTHTAIGKAGEDFVSQFTADYYTSMMKEWESELNHYLKTGSKLSEVRPASPSHKKAHEIHVKRRQSTSRPI